MIKLIYILDTITLKVSINFFDNIPVPKNYLLGPGDEIIISMWGETNLRETFLINKNGSIFVENVGFVNLANNTIDEAEKLLKYGIKKRFFQQSMITQQIL